MLVERPFVGVCFQFLGHPRVVCRNFGCVRVSARKGTALLAYLAMNAGRSLSRSVLAELLWGDRSEAQARQNLRQTIHTLRRDLGPALSAMLQADDQSVSFLANPADVDARRFVEWAEDADPGVRQQCLDIAWAPFLDGFSVDSETFDEWVVAERHRLDTIATRVFAEMVARFDATGDGERAILALERMISIDPGEESRHRRLLGLEARYRGPDAALARAKSLAALLKRALDTEPEAATQALVEDIRRQAKTEDVRPHVPQRVPSAAPTDAAPHAAVSQAGSFRWALPRGAMVLLVAALIVGSGMLGLSWFLPGSPTKQSPSDEPTWQSPALRKRLQPQAVDYSGGGVVALVVMPFANDGPPDKTIELAARMLTADLADALSQLAMFRVISNQTAETYRGQSFDAAAVGRDLGVRYVLDGSIMSRGQILQINTQLVDARTRSVAWSGRFERTGSDLFKVQSEIINEIGREMRLTIEGLEDSQASADPDVHELVFKGWGAINAGRRQGVAALRAAEGYFTEALKREPENTRALNGLAAYQVRMAIQLFVPNPAEYLTKAESIARQLIAQHPKLAGPYVTLGLVQSARDENEAALESFEHAIALNPSNAPVHAHVGRILVDLGYAKEGLEHITYAMRLSPHDPTLTYMFAFAGEAELELGHVDVAIKNFERSAELQPGQPQTLMGLMSAYAMAGRLVDAQSILSHLQKERPYLTTAALLKMLQSKKHHHPIAYEGMSRILVSH